MCHDFSPIIFAMWLVYDMNIEVPCSVLSYTALLDSQESPSTKHEPKVRHIYLALSIYHATQTILSLSKVSRSRVHEIGNGLWKKMLI